MLLKIQQRHNSPDNRSSVRQERKNINEINMFVYLQSLKEGSAQTHFLCNQFNRT